MEKAETKIESDVCVPVTPTLSESEGDATDLCRLPTGAGGSHRTPLLRGVHPGLPISPLAPFLLRHPSRASSALAHSNYVKVKNS